MEHIFDLLSKQLAKAVTRRDAARILARGLFGAFLTGAGLKSGWSLTQARTAGTGPEPVLPVPSAVSDPCGAVQEAIQLAVGDNDPDKYANYTDYVQAATNYAQVALDGGLITETCAGCILDQFIESVPVGQQVACGPVVMPTTLCGAIPASAAPNPIVNPFADSERVHPRVPRGPVVMPNTSATPLGVRIQAAAVLSSGAAPTAWSDAQQFLLMLTLAQEMVGCLFGPPQPIAHPFNREVAHASPAAPPVSSGNQASPDDTTACSGTQRMTPGVDYCGKGNSLNDSLGTLTVAPCLNAG